MADWVEHVSMDRTPPPPGRLAGIDYGTVRVGVAVTDSRQTLASPLEVYARRSAAEDAAHFRALAKEETLAAFVVGLPVHLSGHESSKSHEARLFGEMLGAATGLPVLYFDERYTSVEAERHLLGAKLTSKKRKQRRDQLAAQIMLTAYLEAQAADRPGTA